MRQLWERYELRILYVGCAVIFWRLCWALLGELLSRFWVLLELAPPGDGEWRYLVILLITGLIVLATSFVGLWLSEMFVKEHEFYRRQRLARIFKR